MTTTLSRLLIENNLELGNEGLWVVPGTEQQPFAYSDGDDAENYVYEVIAKASDTSSTSAELESHIRDWPSEYHFTSRRATLLRALDLSGMEHVLELGCGCGAISRYLGEQGMRVDAIEGSTRRAQIARSRCRDLDSVNIVNANYNDLSLPEGEYDAIFLIGVLEYARRFCPDATDDLAAVQDILSTIAGSLKPGGVMITAIENRLGLKYLLGATEDHYAVPYIGLHNYPDSAGIRTFDHDEWLSILDDAGFPDREFYAPFPDYKIPTVVMHEGFLDNQQAPAHLRGLVSRDYLHEFNNDTDEGLFWKAFQQSGTLLKFANSYLIVAGKQDNNTASIASTEFIHVTGSHRKPGYRTVTRMMRGGSLVTKASLSEPEQEQPGLQQVLANEQYIKGELLSEGWLSTLMIWHDMDRLSALFSSYYEYLFAYAADNERSGDIYDVLPFNIIVSPDGQYHSFDREWLLAEKLTPEYVLFRGLFWFAYGNIRHFPALFRKYGFTTIRDFLSYSFNALDIDLDQSIDEYIAFEQRMQQQIGSDVQDGLIRSLLDAEPVSSSGKLNFHPRVYWAEKGKPYSEDKSQIKIAALGAVRQSVQFDIPASLSTGSRIRFDPADTDGYFHIYSLRITSMDVDGNEQVTLLSFDSASALAQSARMNGLTLHGSSSRAVFVANNNDPWFELVLPADGIRFRLEVEMDWPHSEEYEIVRAELQQLNNEWQWEKMKLNEELEKLKRDQADSNTPQPSSANNVFAKLLRKVKF